MHTFRSREILLFSIFIFYVSETQSDYIPYDTIVSFGDSNMDTGNVFNLTSGKWPISPPYYQGRFCNGLLWIERLGISTLVNYAYGGATSDNNLVTSGTALNTVVPGVRQQISIYKNSTNYNKTNFARTVFLIWVGGNDYFFRQTLSAPTVVGSLMAGVNDLIQIGAKYFLIVNQPPLQAYPAAFPLNMSSYLSTLTLTHNSNLSTSIQSLGAKFTDVSLQLLDIYSLITTILMNTTVYGINSTMNCWDTSNNTVLQLCNTPDTYLFLDKYHFPSRIQQLIADNARKLLLTSNGTMKSFQPILFVLSFFALFYAS